MNRFASTRAKKAKRSGLVVNWQEARTRFFYFFNSIALFVICLFVTPTGAMAPHHKGVTTVSVPNHTDANASGNDKRETTGAAPAMRERAEVKVSRDAHRDVVRHGQIKLSSRDIELLARLVYAEGRGEPYEGQVAIAAVVLNRIESPIFPDTVREVILAPNAFSPVRNGHVPKKTNDTARKAVWDAINGKDPSKGSLYFYNPKTATSDWIRTRPQTVRIANHVFAR
jgi:N-acetylmuramoyl-L-alanine amidase